MNDSPILNYIEINNIFKTKFHDKKQMPHLKEIIIKSVQLTFSDESFRSKINSQIELNRKLSSTHTHTHRAVSVAINLSNHVY